jgi:bifunctional DNA-binding transcriptional regulator/antitoxin component of YhaV-PrlF toxin-antitoxin module
VSPLPLTGLHQLPRDTSMLYDIGRVDDSGRVASNDIINALNWRPGSKLDIILTPRTIVIRTAPGGLFSVPRRPRIIPSHVRRAHDIKPGDHVLIAAAPDHGLVIVYPLSALDEMISRYHSAHREAEEPQ